MGIPVFELFFKMKIWRHVSNIFVASFHSRSPLFSDGIASFMIEGLEKEGGIMLFSIYPHTIKIFQCTPIPVHRQITTFSSRSTIFRHIRNMCLLEIKYCISCHMRQSVRFIPPNPALSELSPGVKQIPVYCSKCLNPPPETQVLAPKMI